jgi:hypothetical protein
VFVPRSLLCNGVPQQVYVPVLCYVAPLKVSGLGSRDVQSDCAPAAAGTAAAASPVAQAASPHGLKGRGNRRRRKQQESNPFGPAYMPLKRVSGQSRYSTRSRALPHLPEDVACFDRPAQVKAEAQQSMDALNILAEAAMLELC